MSVPLQKIQSLLSFGRRPPSHQWTHDTIHLLSMKVGTYQTPRILILSMDTSECEHGNYMVLKRLDQLTCLTLNHMFLIGVQGVSSGHTRKAMRLACILM
jgi:hypothetical protein